MASRSAGKSHHQIGEAHQYVTGETTHVAGGDADEEADRDRDAIGNEADQERGARAEQHA